MDKAVIEDARAAAAIMAMNNVYYRFRHIVGKPSYAEKPARLRMNRLVQPAGSKVDFELYALAINGCEACVQAHERTVLEGGLTEDHVTTPCASRPPSTPPPSRWRWPSNRRK